MPLKQSCLSRNEYLLCVASKNLVCSVSAIPIPNFDLPHSRSVPEECRDIRYLNKRCLLLVLAGPTPTGILHDSDVKRFRGAEVVGGDSGARFCCSLM